MKLNCSIADDLMPLYLENSCSEDSKAALEEHLKECADCREKLERMKRGIIPDFKTSAIETEITVYAKKVKRRRIRLAIIAALAGVLAVCILSLCLLAVNDMLSSANPTIWDIEDGVYNLTESHLETTTALVGQYVFYTNTTEIAVKLQDTEHPSGSVMLWDAIDENMIQTSSIKNGSDYCAFTCLSASRRYKITCEGLGEAVITIHDNRRTDFWNSLKNVISGIWAAMS